MRKPIAILLAMVFAVGLLSGCGGGSGDVLKGKWTGPDSNGFSSTLEFDGNGVLKYGSIIVTEGTYTISGSEVVLSLESVFDNQSYTFVVNGKNLTLTPPSGVYYVGFDLTKQ
jgi:hypothetical protein